MNACWNLLGIALNQSMTFEALLHRFAFVALIISLFMLSKMCLLIMPISDFAYIYIYIHSFTERLTFQKYTRFQKGFHIERYIDRYTAISRKVVGKSAGNNPERHCGWF